MWAHDLGDRVVVVEGDATDSADNEQAVADTVSAFGCLDTFIGNAGLRHFSAPLEALPREALSEAFDQMHDAVPIPDVVRELHRRLPRGAGRVVVRQVLRRPHIHRLGAQRFGRPRQVEDAHAAFS